LGELSVEWNLKENNRKLTLEIPEGMTIKIDVKSLDSGNLTHIFVNGKKLKMNPDEKRYILLTAGTQLVEF
jgi:hypothetical protein